MWTYTGNVEWDVASGARLAEVASEAEGEAWQVSVDDVVLGRVQEYAATVEVGQGITRHGATWAFTPNVSVRTTTWAKSAGQTIFGFGTRAAAVRHATTQR